MAAPDDVIALTRKQLDEAIDAGLKRAGFDAAIDRASVALDRAGQAIDARDAALKLIEADPHQWSPRPCQTCSAVTALVGRPFGCRAVPPRS